jgi:glutaredoxin-like YruB-family protein
LEEIIMKNVVVYTSSTCPYCTMVKNHLKEKGVDYVEKNVSTDNQARKELMSMGHMGVPVVLIDGEEVVGFDKDRIDALLGA